MRKKRECVVIALDDYRKKKQNNCVVDKINDKQTLLVFATGRITAELTDAIDASNIDYAIGHLLEMAEDIGDLYKVPGFAAQRMKETSKDIVLSRLKRAKEIKEMVKRAYSEKSVKQKWTFKYT